MTKKIIKAMKIIAQVIIAILATAFIIVGTIFVYYYAKGYRIDLQDRNVRKTGVINIDSSPSRADIIIEGENKGKTTKTIASIDEGFVEVKLKRSGYFDWVKSIEVISEKSTPILAELFRTKPILESKITIQKDFSIEKIHRSNDGNVFIYITKDKNSNLVIWRYDLNRNFWNLSNNPHIVATLTEREIKNLKLYSSPSSQNILLIYNHTLDKSTETKIQLFNTQQTDSSGRSMDLEKFITSGYTFTWSESENYIVMESSTDILSFNINNQAKYLLYKKSPKESVVWTSDSQSNFYYTQKDKDESGTYLSLEQLNMDGTGNKTLIPRIYFQTDIKYIEEIRKGEDENNAFTNAPQNTRFSGDVIGIKIDQATKGIFMTTEQSSYWYDTTSDKYVIINPYKTDFVSYSPNRQSLLYKDNNNKYIGIFTFDKDESDPITKLGSKIIIKNADNVSDLKWITNSNLTFTLNDTVNIIDKDGDNQYTISIEKYPSTYSTVGNGKYMHTIEKNSDGSNQIVRYVIQ
ncbi:MAG TPA: PEGA domain-containing protein [Candidatus Dojkabacteria bacterium]|nr:PEGA domain-containing protein [Candidatus Dojkabacteria bacterium]